MAENQKENEMITRKIEAYEEALKASWELLGNALEANLQNRSYFKIAVRFIPAKIYGSGQFVEQLKEFQSKILEIRDQGFSESYFREITDGMDNLILMARNEIGSQENYIPLDVANEGDE